MNSKVLEIKKLSDCLKNFRKKSTALVFDGFENENIILTQEKLVESLDKVKISHIFK